MCDWSPSRLSQELHAFVQAVGESAHAVWHEGPAPRIAEFTSHLICKALWEYAKHRMATLTLADVEAAVVSQSVYHTQGVLIGEVPLMMVEGEGEEEGEGSVPGPTHSIHAPACACTPLYLQGCTPPVDANVRALLAVSALERVQRALQVPTSPFASAVADALRVFGEGERKRRGRGRPRKVWPRGVPRATRPVPAPLPPAPSSSSSVCMLLL